MASPAHFTDLASVALPPGPVHLAIGMFDGVHLGHRATLEPAIRAARQGGGTAAVLTFSPHPSVLFHPQNPTRLIQTSATKIAVLGTLGIDAVISQTFDADFAHMAAEEFLPWLRRYLPALAAVYVGDNFRFGCKRHGDAAFLRRSGAALGVAVHAAAPVRVHGEWVSSTRIRAHLSAGEIDVANALLGYRYFANGPVLPGKKLGRTLGFPTLNLTWSPELRPRFGVYAVQVRATSRAESLPAVANYGLRPTVESTNEPKLEVHVLGDCPYDAGDLITVEWLYFLRPERKFANVDELRGQIERDREAARSRLT